MDQELGHFIFETPQGAFLASYSDRGLARLRFPEDKPARIEFPEKSISPNWLNATKAAIEARLEGQSSLEFPPFDLAAGTEFQKLVWNALLKIETGKTLTYGEVALQIGRPGAVRAIGQACGANPIPLLIPCHRVLASGLKLGGFSGPAGWKEKLLAIEGILLKEF